MKSHFTLITLFALILSSATSHAQYNVPQNTPQNFSSPAGLEINTDSIPKPRPWYDHQIKVLPIITCNEDGSDPGLITRQQVQAGLDEANIINQRSGFLNLYVIDPRADFANCVRSTAMNQDCALPAGVDPAQIATYVETYTDKDVNGDGSENDADIDAICDYAPTRASRNTYALDFLGSVVIYFPGMVNARRTIKWDKTLGHYVYKKPTGGASSYGGNYVLMNGFPNPASRPGNLYAHELGHYMSLKHTMNDRTMPDDVNELISKIQTYVDNHPELSRPADLPTVIVKLFDPDEKADNDDLHRNLHRVFDTPPDPGNIVWKNVYGRNFCAVANSQLTITVNMKNAAGADVPTQFTFQPDRSLIMSYFKGCTNFDQHYSPHQVRRMNDGLENRRSHLIKKEPVFCFAKKEAAARQNQGLYSLFNERMVHLDNCIGVYDQTFVSKKFASFVYLDEIMRARLLLEDMKEDFEIDDPSVDPLLDNMMPVTEIKPVVTMPKTSIQKTLPRPKPAF